MEPPENDTIDKIITFCISGTRVPTPCIIPLLLIKYTPEQKAQVEKELQERRAKAEILENA